VSVETMQLAHFWIFGGAALLSALLFVTRKSPVAAALWLVNVMFSLAGCYVLLGAPFVGAVQVLVYAGAIMVVFLFVVMLLNLGRDDTATDLRSAGVRAGAVLVAVMLAAEVYVAARTPGAATAPAPTADASGNVVVPVAQALFREHLVAFEMTSVLLLASIVGAVLLARRETAADVARAQEAR
jgi:NADH-quinone oxidoreductase subunit J